MTRTCPGRRPLLVAVVGVLLASAACVNVPGSGSVQHVDSEPPAEPDPALYDPPGPKLDGSPVEIVEGFFGAMGAVPITTADAKEFLTAPARRQWRPTARTIVYEGEIDVRPVADNVVEARSRQVGVVEPNGTFRPVPPPSTRKVNLLTLRREDGQWRIATPANAFYVDSYFFERQYEPFSLYFVGPSGDTTVPVPIYLPIAEQPATEPATKLVSAVLAGPPPQWRGDLGSWVPPLTELDISVPITSAGVAEVRLSGPILDLTLERRRRLSTQLVWTLSQVPGVSGVRILVDGVPLVVGEPDVQDVDQASPFDPSDVSRDHLYALRSGRLVKVDGRAGARNMPRSMWGAQRQGIRSFDVGLQLDRLVAVSEDGQRLLAGPLFGSADGSPSTLHVDGHDLATPVATSGRQWLVVDRRLDNTSRLLVSRGDSVRTASMGDVGQERVEALSLSPDGMRFAALSRRVTRHGLGPPRIMIGRVDRGPDGYRVDRLTGAREFVVASNTLRDVRSVGWADATTLAVLAGAEDSDVVPYTARIDGSSLVNEWLLPAAIDPKRLVTSAGADREVYLVEEADPDRLWFFDGADWHQTDEDGLEALNFVG